MGVGITYQQYINEDGHKTKISKCKLFKENVYDETYIKNLRFRLKEENERNKTIRIAIAAVMSVSRRNNNNIVL